MFRPTMKTVSHFGFALLIANSLSAAASQDGSDATGQGKAADNTPTFSQVLEKSPPAVQQKVSDLRNQVLNKLATMDYSKTLIHRGFICLGIQAAFFLSAEGFICEEATVRHIPATALVLTGGIKWIEADGGLFMMTYDGPPVSLREGYFTLNDTLTLAGAIGIGGDDYVNKETSGALGFGGLLAGFAFNFTGTAPLPMYLKFLETHSTENIQNRFVNGEYQM